MDKGQFLYWRMENGHEHSFMSYENDNILSEFATANECGELTQEEYIEYVEKNEDTILEELIVINFQELTIELSQEWLEKDYIASFELEEKDLIIEFY